MATQPNRINFKVPDWIHDFIINQDIILEIEDRMQLVIEASRRNVIEKTGGPFAAAIFESDSGKLISLGTNLVTTQGLSILHAEIVAITVAQNILGTYDLGRKNKPRHELVTSAEPCAMCFGAIPWSGVYRVITSARDVDVRNIGFDEGPKLDDWSSSLKKRHIDVICDIKRDEAKQVLTEYSKLGGAIYNSRESS
ncbi:Cytidine and deoxycytidylate deaminase family protein [hydrothermal vent metagenome]|uniref:Cytidine and deoxycytidylate deaminase family protein n=1 Tax=hydrothermal vent metagenome TaxID=652676 RepID=A0A3B1DIG0_9ZZZZ